MLKFEPFWSAWIELSNDVNFVVGWILSQNREKPWIIASGWVWFLAKMWPTSKITYRTSFESSFDADHNGTIPRFIPHSHTKIQRVFSWITIGCLHYCDQQEWSFQMMSFLLWQWTKIHPSTLKTSSDLPDIQVNWCFGSEMVLLTVFYFKVES